MSFMWTSQSADEGHVLFQWRPLSLILVYYLELKVHAAAERQQRPCESQVSFFPASSRHPFQRKRPACSLIGAFICVFKPVPSLVAAFCANLLADSSGACVSVRMKLVSDFVFYWIKVRYFIPYRSKKIFYMIKCRFSNNTLRLVFRTSRELCKKRTDFIPNTSFWERHCRG